MRTYHVLLFISYDKLKKYSKRNIKDYDKLWKYYKETFSLDSSYRLWKLLSSQNDLQQLLFKLETCLLNSFPYFQM